MATKEQVVSALSKVNDPELHKDLVTLGMVKDVHADGASVRLGIELTTPACPLKDKIRGDVEAALKAIGVDRVDITWGAQVRSGRAALNAGDFLPQVKNVLLVGSGKGGVGKSTVAANLACALQRLGAKTGLLDADIYGPSVPTMFGTHEKPKMAENGKQLEPVKAFGLELMSIGFLVDPNEAIVWRGPMLASAVQQFMKDVAWSALDYLIVDLPPGTGDVQLTLSQTLKVSGALVVTTPQTVALADVVRAKAMFDKVNIPVIGLVENMSSFVCGKCDTRHYIFDRGGGERAAAGMNVPFLGELPLVTDVREAGDAGIPIVERAPESPGGKAFLSLAGRVADRLSVLAARQTSLKIVA
ncbi:MAG: Mrp/NBP35 family ATP-binding protein [Deltaproteobacteria bacterium]|nr:Mrp/NBP35 family ATP-binding protein [Deltaproteobacteria bacterium]